MDEKIVKHVYVRKYIYIYIVMIHFIDGYN